jgi:hypothetical protein
MFQLGTHWIRTLENLANWATLDGTQSFGACLGIEGCTHTLHRSHTSTAWMVGSMIKTISW